MSLSAPRLGFLPALAFAAVVALAAPAAAQDLAIYDDALQNGFQDWSYGGIPSDFDFNSTTNVHGGTTAIRFVGDASAGYPDALSFAHPGGAFTTAQYPKIHFWVHGGTTGGQQLRIYLQLGSPSAVVAQAELDSYITGGAIAANAWREVTVAITSGALSYSGSFDRVDLASDSVGSQPALWVDDLSLQPPAAAPAGTMTIEHDVTAGSMVSDRFTWQDSANLPRVAVLAHNDGQVGPGGTRGGELREFRYETGAGTRIVRASSSGASGFGYVVSHPEGGEACWAGAPDTSMLGHFVTGTWSRVFEGRHHAIFRFTQSYPRYCAVGAAPGGAIPLPVTIDWVFATGRDHPLWSITWDLSGVTVNRLEDDSRAPYGELLFDGAATEGAHSTIAGVGWGDRYRFLSTTNPVTPNSAWSWSAANTIPWVKLWTTAVSATMGTVATRPITQQDAGGYWGTNRWGSSSGGGNGCTVAIGGVDTTMPCDFNWPYQSINYSLGSWAPNTPTNNTRLAWGTNFGFLGQSAYYVHGSAYYGGPLPNATAPGWPKKSYSVFVVLGLHSATPVETQITQMETAQTLTLTASTGSVATSGPAGVVRVDTATYTPAGWNHVLGALAFNSAANLLDANVAVGSGTFRKPLIVVSGFTGATNPTVKLGGTALVPDVDYFASRRTSPDELWVTLNRDLTGATNHLEIVASCAAAPASEVAAVNLSKSGGSLVVRWANLGDAGSYDVYQDTDPNGAFATLTGTATSGLSGLTVGMPAGSAVSFRVAGRNGCGLGPK
jgi:hypothetical protein